MIVFDKKIWLRKSVSNKHNTAWKCGACGVGGLQLRGEIPKVSYYSIALRCTDSNCLKEYRVVGPVVPEANGREVTMKYFQIDNYRLYPTHFEPELVMFELPTAISEEVKQRLIKSFNHFWYDRDACANMIRQVVEIIVDKLGGQGESLHAKIVSIKGKLGEDLSKRMAALKWIGNDGRHPGRSFTREEILDAYELLVSVLNYLYPDESEKARRDSLVEFVLKNKGMKQS